MSVNNEDIDFKKAFEKSAGPAKPVVKKNEVKQDDVDFSKAFQTSVKKKDTPPVSTNGSKDVPAGGAAVSGTTSTTPATKWEDNPLNPVKAASDYEAARDKTPEILFKADDQQKLSSLLAKHKVAPASTQIEKPFILDPASNFVTPRPKTEMEIEYDNSDNLVKTLKSQIDNYRIAREGQRGAKKSQQEIDAEKDLQEAETLKRKAWNELAVNGDKQVEVLSRQDDSGNSFKRTMNEMFGSKPGAWQTEKAAIEDKVAKMPTSFLTGMNILKGTEPAEYERVADAITSGIPVSQSQLAKITNLGLNLEQAKLERDIIKSPVTPQERQQVTEITKSLGEIKTDLDKYEGLIKSKQQLTPDQVEDYKSKIQQYNTTVTQYKPLLEKVNAVDGAFAKRAKDIQESKMKNLVDNPEVFRGFIADGVANKLDEIGKKSKSPNVVNDFMTGHTWNYSPEQIKWASEQYLKEQGIDPNTPQAKAAIKYLQDNEGVMIGENSIAKAGGIREFAMGAVEPIEGVGKFIDDMTRPSNDVYAESQSQGNVQVARKRLESEDKGVRGVINDVLKGTGQFATQAAMMAATSGAIGTVAESIMGKAGVQLLADAKAANLKTSFAFDDATANMAVGKVLTTIKNPVSVFTTSYAMSYDGNLKAALSYTSDNSLAKKAASFNSAMEGATELFLSPLDIATGIYNKFSKAQTKDLLKILSSKSLKNDPSALKQYVGQFVKGVLGTAKVAGAEIGEEMVTQISDYVTNMYLNPNADSFKNRDLQKELMTTAYQTGLSMAVPALLNGIGAAKANTFSKGSLLVAAQNRQAMVDNLNKQVATGEVSQEYADQQIQLINTAAVANSQVPKKVNGAELNTNEKANYIWSRTTEAYMKKQMDATDDAAQKELWKDKIAKQQEYRKQIIGLAEEKPEVPEYTIEGKPVGREEFMRALEEKPDGDYFVANDEEAQAALRKIGGIDDKTDSEVTSAVITIGGKTYEGKNHAEAILKAKADGKDISQVDRKRDGKFKLSDGTIIDRAEAKKRFGQDRSELLIEQDEAADAANKEYRKSDKDLVNEVEEKGIKNYEKTNITELKEQSLQAPASLKNQFDDEELVVDLIAKNTPEQIEDAIKYQQGRIEADSNMDEVSMKGIDDHIQLLEKGLEKSKEFAEVEENPVEKSEGQPLSKIDQLAAKKFLDKENVPGKTIDDKLRYISEQPEGTFGQKLSSLAEKRFPKAAEKTKPVSSTTTEVSGKDAEIEKIENEIEAITPRYNELVDIVNKKERKLSDEPSPEEIELKGIQKEMNGLIDKRNKLQQSGKDGVVDNTTPKGNTSNAEDFKVIDRPSLEKKINNIGEAPNLEQIRSDDVAKQKKSHNDKMAIVDKVKGMSEKEYQRYYNETNPDNLPSHPLGLRNTKQATISQFEGDFKPTDYEASDAKKKHGEKILDAIGSVDNVTENLTKKNQLTPEKQTALSNQRNKLEKQLNELGIELYTPKKNTPLEVGKVKVVDADKSGSDNVVEVVRLGLIDKKTGQVIKEAEVITGEQSLSTPKGKEVVQPSNVGEGETALKDVESAAKALEEGDKIQWNVFGNEESGEWNVVGKTKTRGGKDAVILSKVYVEASSDGKSYTKEYADANGIKYDNESTVEHIVPLEDLKSESLLSKEKPQEVVEPKPIKNEEAKAIETPSKEVVPDVVVDKDVTEAEKMQFGAGYKDYSFKKETLPTDKIKITEQPSLSEKSTLVEDIKKNGIKEPIVVEYDKESDTYYIKNGNNRAAIAKELGIKEIPTIIAEYKEKGKSTQIAPDSNAEPINQKEGVGVTDVNIQQKSLSKEKPQEVVEPTKIQKLEKEYEGKTVDELVALKKELYPNPDIESAMTPEEKLLDKVISKKFSDINAQVIQKRKSQKEVQLAEAEKQEPKITDVNLDKEIGLLSAEFLEINKPEIAQGSQRIKIVDVPLSSIGTDTGSFQNRETEFSQESVDKILKAVQEDTFNWTEFDPITLWKNNGELKVLSGHSRFEAFKQLVKRGYAGFDTIPAEIFEGTKEQATAIALRSNTLSTKETPIERANYYRDARLLGTSSKAISTEAREYEGRNAPTIIALSYLNPNGKAIAFLKALGQEGDTKSKANSLQMARWTGEVRQMFPQLTNEHENEIFDWLKDGAYNKIKNLPEITSRINNVVSGFDFDSEKPLNLANKGTKTYVDDQYEQEVADKEKQIKEQQKVIADKAVKLNEAGLLPQEVAERLVPDNAILSRMQQDYMKLKDKKGAISEANKGILSLFDNIQTEIDNGTITGKQAEEFINNTGEVEESDPIIEDIERNAESADTASTAIEEGEQLIAGQDVNAKRIEKAEAKLAEKVGELEKEKTARINEVTKPEIDMNTMLINDLFTMAGTTEANRQEYEEIKNQLYGLKNIIDCLFS